MVRKAHPVAVLAVVLYTLVVMLPIGWMVITAIKHPADVSASPPRWVPGGEGEGAVFEVTWRNFEALFASEDVGRYLWNSVLVAVVSTVASVFLGAFAAYGFSRFRVPGGKDWLFFILSTRMLPALAVSVPISWMYASVNSWTGLRVLMDAPFGLILLYTCFNLSFSTWMMKAFIDEIPKAYEEAALLDGYTRVQVLFKIILPEAGTGLVATAVFCLIAAWNEYAFALTLTQTHAVTMPVYLQAVVGDTSRQPWGPMAAGALLFMTPIVVFSLLMRKHLLRGITFGAVKG